MGTATLCVGKGGIGNVSLHWIWAIHTHMLPVCSTDPAIIKLLLSPGVLPSVTSIISATIPIASSTTSLIVSKFVV
eukprot:7669793-Ditylum_brightwellii.AAC.1